MIRFFMRTKLFKILNASLLLFYKKEFLTGYYYNKVMSWLWVWKWVPFELLRFNRKVPWPGDISVRIHNPKNLIFGHNDIYIFQSPEIYLVTKTFNEDNMVIAENPRKIVKQLV